MIYIDPADYEYLSQRDANAQKQDPFAYGRKKSKESGKVSDEYLKQRRKDYRKYGIGSPFGITVASKKNSYKPVNKIAQTNTVLKSKKPSKQSRKIKRFIDGLRNG